MFSIKADLLINDQIHVPEVRLVGANGEQLGIKTLAEAQELADEAELDLALIAPKGEPPVCRIMDYSKYRFEQMKREKDARKNQKVISVKEVRLSPVIEEHDIGVRQKNARKFLSDGDKCKVVVAFRGRQMAHTDIGITILNDFAQQLEDIAVVERRPMMEGRHMFMILAPKAEK